MSMDHKAFAFDYAAFVGTLASTIHTSLSTNNTTDLVNFISANLADITDPYEGESLSAYWKSEFDTEDVQLVADIALTRFYDPSANFGLGNEWAETEEALGVLGLDAATILLGEVIGPTECLFDPGKMGAYFQSSDLVKENIASLLNAPKADHESRHVAAAFGMLRRAQVARCGLYITF